MTSSIAADTVVATEGLTRRFGRRRGIIDVTFGVARGEVFGFLGPNGAGKSTTIRLLLGLYLPSAGRAVVFGLEPRRDSVEVQRRVGYLPGELALFPRLTGRQILDRVAGSAGIAITAIVTSSSTGSQSSSTGRCAPCPKATSKRSGWFSLSRTDPNCSFSTNPPPVLIRFYWG